MLYTLHSLILLQRTVRKIKKKIDKHLKKMKVLKGHLSILSVSILKHQQPY